MEWQGINDVGVHIQHDPTVNLASTALSGDIFHQPGSPCVRGTVLQYFDYNTFITAVSLRFFILQL